MNRVKARSSVPDFSANGGQSAPAAPVSPTRGASSARATARPRLAKQKIAVKSVGDGAGGLIRRIAEIHPPATSKRDLFGPAHFVVVRLIFCFALQTNMFMRSASRSTLTPMTMKCHS